MAGIKLNKNVTIPTAKAMKVLKRGAAHASHTRLEFYSETLERQEVLTDRLGYWGNKKKKKSYRPPNSKTFLNHMKVSLRGMKTTVTVEVDSPHFNVCQRVAVGTFWNKSISSLLAYSVLDKTQ